MRIEELMKSGYELRSWTVSKVRGEARIVLNLSRLSGRTKIYYYVSSCICSEGVKLNEAIFCDPVFLS